MSNNIQMTKRALLDRATELHIVGRHEMNKLALFEAIDACFTRRVNEVEVETSVRADETSVRADETSVRANEAAVAELEQKAEAPTFTKTDVKKLVTRHRSSKKRDENGVVIRSGHNLSGNLPFSRKFYYLDMKFADGPYYHEAYKALPKQAKGLINYLVDANVTNASKSMIGNDIANQAKAAGFVKSKIESAVLFAYYRRALNLLGVTAK